MKHYQEKSHFQLNDLSQRFQNLSQNKGKCFFTKNELIQLIDYYEFENLPENALEVIEYGIHFFQNSPSFKVKKTRMLLYHYHYQLAIEILGKKQSEALSPSQHDLLQLEILVVKQQFNEALKMVDGLKEIYGKTRKILSDIYYLESTIYERQNDYSKSFEALSEALWINYNHKDALGKIWMITELSKKWEESVVLHQYLLKKEHYSAMTWFNLGHAYYGKCEYNKAIDAFYWCILIDENFEPAYADIAEVLEIQQRYLEAAQFVNKAIIKFKLDELDYFLKCGEYFLKAEQYDNAVRILEEGIKNFDDPDLWFYLGEAKRFQKDFKMSVVCYNNALAISEYRDDIHNGLGISQFYLANYFEAEEHLAKAIEYAPFETSYRTTLASIQLNINELEKGEEILSTAVQEIPDTSLRYQLAAILILNNKRSEGLAELSNALETDSNLVEEFFNFAPELDKKDKEIDRMIQYFCPNWSRT